MIVAYRLVFPVMWLLWAAYWWLASYAAKHTDRREPLGSRLLHVLPLLFSGWLLWSDRLDGSFLGVRMFPRTTWVFWAATLITAVGLLFAVWARVHLGRNWSGTVTIKQDHELIVSGPYALVRHPIYTGLLVALLGTATARGEWRGLLAVLIAGAALWRKLGVEERWMTERFGQQYEDYRRRVPALVPRLKARG
jgi:protein-S-isoprenylcysteine O-methyltransferase Ste14